MYTTITIVNLKFNFCRVLKQDRLVIDVIVVGTYYIKSD